MLYYYLVVCESAIYITILTWQHGKHFHSSAGACARGIPSRISDSGTLWHLLKLQSVSFRSPYQEFNAFQCHSKPKSIYVRCLFRIQCPRLGELQWHLPNVCCWRWWLWDQSKRFRCLHMRGRGLGGLWWFVAARRMNYFGTLTCTVIIS